MTSIQLQELLRLPVAERLDLIEALWDSIAESGEAMLDVPDAHKAELDRRWAEHQRNPGDVVSWGEVKAGLLKRKRVISWRSPGRQLPT